MQELQVINNSKTLDSREVAEMMEINHKDLLKKIDGINKDFVERNIALNKYWEESFYLDRLSRTHRNFQITKRGCEFLANKTTGTKGNLFTDRYMDRFEEMKQVIKELQPTPSYMIEDPIERAKVWITEQEKLQAEQEKVKQLGEENKANKPKVIFADAVATSQTSILVGELAKILKQNDIEIGEKRLFKWLRNNGYLIKRNGSDYNMPTQKSVDLGVIEIKERAINNPDGSVRVTKTPKVTGKGQQYFINKFLNNKEEQ